jgi:RHS repeat-associated protein
MTQIGLGTSSSDSSVLQLDYGFGTTNNNGNVLKQTITVPGLTLNQCYGYDSLNRLSTAEERSGATVCAGTQQWKQAFSYDRFGNRNLDGANTTANVLGPNPTINQATNRIATGQNYGYDNTGNLTSDPTTPMNGIVYDAENRQIQYTRTGQATNNYFYDGDGHRVKKIDSTGTTLFVYDMQGQLTAEYTSGSPSGGGTSYFTGDHLGSTRVVTDANGGVKARHDYLPFGEEILVGIGGRTAEQGYITDTVRQKFTQKERDNESGLDYFEARYYSSAQGRFTSVDPGNAGARRKDPQSWNAYDYGRNNPLRYIDPDGTTYRLYDLDGNWQDISDENADEWRKKDGVVFKDGKIFDKDGNQLGTYRRTWDDSASLNFNLFIYGREGMAARAAAMNQSIVAFGAGTVVIGATGGAAAYFGGIAFGGSSLTTLEIGQATGTAVETGAATIGINARIYAQLERQLAKDGPQSVYKALRSAQETLQEHIDKLRSGLRYTSKVESTIRNVQKQIETIKQFIKDKGL